jgi:lipid-binding SYLF domain-containing protein
MRRCFPWFPVAVALLAFQVPVPGYGAGEREAGIVGSAADVLDEIAGIPEQGIPSQLLREARGVAVVPGLIKVGLILGARHGRGVLMVRDPTGGWSNPVFVTLTGGSLGYQVGAQSSDIVLVFRSGKSVDGILKGKFTLGADAGVAAGPVGRRAEAATDARLKAEIFSYSRSRGAFIGVSLEGSALLIDDGANATYYGKEGILPAEIVSGGGVSAPRGAGKLKATLRTLAEDAAR